MSENPDHFSDAKTGVLKNRLGIISQAELERAEADFAAVRSYELALNPLEGNFDFGHLKNLHYALFKDVYEWAGQARDVDLTKGSHFFAHFEHIEGAAAELFSKLAEEKFLGGLVKEQFCERAAFYLSEINALHPFLDGNGRAQREFISHLAYKNGYFIAWEDISEEDNIKSSAEAFRGDVTDLAAYILGNISDLEEGKK